MSEGYQLYYCWILKLLSGPRIFKLTNLCDNQLTSIPYSFLYLCSFWFGENIPTAECGMISAETACWKFLMRTFTCRSTFLYVAGRSNLAGQSLIVKTALRTERVYEHHRFIRNRPSNPVIGKWGRGGGGRGRHTKNSREKAGWKGRISIVYTRVPP